MKYLVNKNQIVNNISFDLQIDISSNRDNFCV